MDITLEDLKENRQKYTWGLTFLYTAIALSLIHYTEYGIYLVVAHLIHSVQSTGGYQLLNVKESNDHIGKLYSKLNDQEKLIEEMSNKIDSFERS